MQPKESALCSVQEAVYLAMPELWLWKIFSKTLFLNNNIRRKRYRIYHNREEIDELPEDSTDIFQRNKLDRYVDWPDKNLDNQYMVEDVMQLMPFLLQDLFHSIILHQSQSKR